MKYVFLDYETFWARDYTLQKLDPPSYILDPRFKVLCLGVAEGFRGVPYIVEGPDIPKFFADIGPDVAMVTHNALFDQSINAWIYGYSPKLMVDTLSMSRTLLSHKLRSHALGKVAAYFGWEKGDMAQQACGMGLEDLKANGMWEDYKSYCMQDVTLCRGIYLKLCEQLPTEEFILHDMIHRCAVEPQFRVDVGLLNQHLGEIDHYKQKLFAKAMFAGLHDKTQLMSNPQFAELLKQYGVALPMIVSKATNKLTYSFSKSNPEFLALLEHDDPRVVALVEARLEFKSTIEETRTARMINIGQLTFPGKGEGWMPIPLNVAAAHTHRLGGGWKLNPQNWGRKSTIRNAIIAPDGHTIVAADSEQIEARMNAWFCGQTDLLDQFRRGEDVYSNFASDSIFHVPVTKATEPAKRFIGKTAILQLGYQSGIEKFKNTVWLNSYHYEDEPVVLSDHESAIIVEAYRQRYPMIPLMWDRLKHLIQFMAQAENTERSSVVGPITFGGNHFTGPNGLKVWFERLHYDHEDRQWMYRYNDIPTKLYGGKLLATCVQFLARVTTMQAAIRLRKPLQQFSSRLTHTAHDELVYVVPDQYIEDVKALIRTEMTVAPAWAPTLPLAVSIGTGHSYGDCK